MGHLVIGLALLGMAGVQAPQHPAPTPQGGATPAAERKICKRSAPSGSLIETRRECHTRQEWDQIAQNARATGQDMVSRASAGTQP